MKMLPDGEDNKGWFVVNIRLIVGIIGAAACFAWFFTFLTSQNIYPLPASTPDAFLEHIAFLAGVITSLVFSHAASDQVSANRHKIFCLSLILAAIGFIGMTLGRTSELRLTAFLFSGLGFGSLYPLYGEYLSFFLGCSIEQYVRIIALIAAIALALSAIAGEFILSIASALIPLVAYAAFAFVLTTQKLHKLGYIDKSTSDSRHRVTQRSYLSTAVSGFAMGYAAGIIISLKSTVPWSTIAAGIALVGACLVSLIDMKKDERLSEATIMRFFLPVSAVAVIPIMFASDEIRVILAALLLAWSIFPTLCSVSAICLHIGIFELSAIRAFSFGRIMSFLGIAAGVLLALLGFTPSILILFPDLPGPAISAISASFFLLITILAASFVMTFDNYPSKQLVWQSDNTDNTSLPRPQGAPIKSIDGSAAKQETDLDQPTENEEGIFSKKCELVAREYGLSTRQREVFLLLAKGRNADYISKKLIVSPHTAKAHIYNIYQKTNVHSRQELIDLVEETEFEGHGIS